MSYNIQCPSSSHTEHHRVYGRGDNPVFRKLRNEYRYTILLLAIITTNTIIIII